MPGVTTTSSIRSRRTIYYALAGIFKSSKTMDNFNVVARWQERPLAVPEVVAQRDDEEAEANAVQAQIQQVRIQEALVSTKRERAGSPTICWQSDRQIRRDES